MRSVRIIPAYAGSTVIIDAQKAYDKDHPRIRGEHVFVGRERNHRDGSSPHTRGAPLAILEGSISQRIIPAYAGSTFSRIFPALPKADHPRIRGEHTWKSLQYQGSPP